MSGTTMLDFWDQQGGAVWRSEAGTMREIGVVKISSPTAGDNKVDTPVEFFVDDAKRDKHHKVSRTDWHNYHYLKANSLCSAT